MDKCCFSECNNEDSAAPTIYCSKCKNSYHSECTVKTGAIVTLKNNVITSFLCPQCVALDDLTLESMNGLTQVDNMESDSNKAQLPEIPLYLKKLISATAHEASAKTVLNDENKIQEIISNAIKQNSASIQLDIKKCIQEEINPIKEQVQSHESEIHSMKDSIHKIQKSIESSSNLATNLNLNSLSAELNERMRKSHNVRLFNLTESNSSSALDRMNFDKSAASKILSKCNDINTANLKVRRIGKINKDSNMPRPVLVTLSSPVEALAVIKNKRKIEGPYSIGADLTDMQRQEFSDLKKEVDALNADGANKVIRYVNNVPTIVDAQNDRPVQRVQTEQETQVEHQAQVHVMNDGSDIVNASAPTASQLFSQDNSLGLNGNQSNNSISSPLPGYSKAASSSQKSSLKRKRTFKTASAPIAKRGRKPKGPKNALFESITKT